MLNLGEFNKYSTTAKDIKSSRQISNRSTTTITRNTPQASVEIMIDLMPIELMIQKTGICCDQLCSCRYCTSCSLLFSHASFLASRITINKQSISKLEPCHIILSNKLEVLIVKSREMLRLFSALFPQSAVHFSLSLPSSA